MKHAKVWFNQNLTSPEKLVFMAIASINADDRQAVTVARMMIMTSLSRRAVQYATKRLRDLGLIIAEPRDSSSTMYRAVEQ